MIFAMLVSNCSSRRMKLAIYFILPAYSELALLMADPRGTGFRGICALSHGILMLA